MFPHYSLYNEEEMQLVLKYIKTLLETKSKNKSFKQIQQSDIGIVTPYRKQRTLLAEKLRRYHYENITIGTAEVFQGKEKPVMIVSTVRSDGKLGFVAEERVSIII